MNNLMALCVGLCLSSGLLASCGSKPPAPATTPTTTTTTTSAVSETEALALAFGEIKLIDRGEEPLLIHADGRLEMSGNQVGTIHDDGTITRSTGELVVALQRDGRVLDGKGKDLGVRLSTDGALVANGRTLTIDADGALVGSEGPAMKIEGATTPALKRTAMLALVALTAKGNHHPVGEVTGGE